MQPLLDKAIEDGDDPKALQERIAMAAMYSNIFNVSRGDAFLNLETYNQMWMGQSDVKKTGPQAVWDSLQLNFVTAEYNRLSQQLARAGGNDPHLLQAIEETERRIDQLRDHAPKIWSDEYVKQGGWHDVGQFVRSVSTTMAENAGHIIKGIGAAALASTGVGAIASAAGLSAGTSALLVAGASKLAIAGSTYDSTWGIKYREMTTAGIPHDIAINFARQDALIEGLIEGALGGVESAGAKTIASAIVPKAVGNATSRWFISGKMGVGARTALNIIQQGAEEGTEEFIQALSSGNIYNEAVEYANRQGREDLQRQIANAYTDEVRRELEKELDNYTDIDKKEINTIFDEAVEGFWGGFWTGILLGTPVSVTGGINDSRAAATLARMAQIAPNEAAFVEAVKDAQAQGFEIPIKDFNKMATDDQSDILTRVYKTNQERLTPEQQKAKQEAAQDAESLDEVIDYRNALRQDDVVDKDTGETKTVLTKPDTSNIYRENDKLAITHYTDTQEDGSVDGRFIAADTRIEDTEETGKQWYGYINYTESNGKINIDQFKMMYGFEDLRQELFNQFALENSRKEITLNFKHAQNRVIRDELINNNPRGGKYGLNYYEQGDDPIVSNEARQIARRFTPFMNKSTPLEISIAAELFNSFYKRRGESIGGAMNRLLGNITNDPSSNSRIETAAQRSPQGRTQIIKGATWLERTAEGMRNFVYLNKNAADVSTVIHETGHIIAKDFTDAERRIAARALDGYQLKNGTTVYFNENAQWSDEQHEAFAEALENYLTNGKAPNEQIKTIFERIKEFMKRIYEKFKGWTELSPKVEEFYKSLLSGELADQAKAETSNQTHEDARSEVLSENTINDTDEITETQNETSSWENMNQTIDNILKDLDEIRELLISDPDISLEAKTESVLDAAGEVLLQTREKEMDENPIGYLKSLAQNITDTAERDEVIAELDRLEELYPPESNKYIAPNGKPSNLNHAQWYAVRTTNFKNWFGDWESAAEIQQIENNLQNFISELETAKKGTREEIFNKYGNDLKPIAYIPKEYLQYFKGTATNNRIYTGLGYFIDHAINHHPEIYTSRYNDIQEIILNNDEVIIDNRINDATGENRDNLIFVKKYDKNVVLIVSLETNKEGQILFHKTLHHGKKNLYPGLPRVQNISPVDGVPTINTADKSTFAGSLSAPDDTSIIGNFIAPVNPDSVSKVIDENGEPIVVYHGTKEYFTEFDVGERTGYAGRRQAGSFFTVDITRANSYGINLYGCFLNIKKPYITNNYPEISTLNNVKINNLKTSGYDGVIFNELADKDNPYAPENNRLFEEINVFDSNQIKSATDNIGTFDPRNPSILFQFGDTDMVEEAADFENGKEYRTHIEEKQGYPSSFHEDFMNYTEEQIDAWYEEFVKKSKQAKNSSEQITETTSKKKAAPEETDKEFNELIEQPGELEKFVEHIVVDYKEDLSKLQPIDEQDAEDIEKAIEIQRKLHRVLKHETWQRLINAGEITGEQQRKALLSMIQASPRDYRDIYADVMEREEFKVSPEDSTTAALKYRVTDSRKNDVDFMTPEKLRQFAARLDIEDYAKKVDSGKALYNDPVQKAYIKDLRDKLNRAEETLKEFEAARQEDNNYIERQISKKFKEKFEEALKAREEIRRKNDKLDRAIRTGERDLSDITRRLKREKADYDSLVQDLQAQARIHDLEIDVQAILADERISNAVKAARTETKEKWEAKLDAVREEYKDFRKSAKTEATLTVSLARKAAIEELKTHITDLNEQRKAVKEMNQAKRKVVKVINEKITSDVNAVQGMTIAIIQNFVYPSIKKSINEFIGEIVEHDLRPVFEAWKVDEKLRNNLLKDKPSATKRRMRQLFAKENYDDLTEDNKKYLARKIAPEDRIEELGLEEIAQRREKDYPMTEERRQLVKQYLPEDVYYRIMDKPFSQWTLNEAQELAKIIHDLKILGKNLYKAHIEAERRRINAYRLAIVNTIRTVKPGIGAEEAEKILGKFRVDKDGTAQSEFKRRSLKGALARYQDMNVYRFTRMLDNGELNGKNMSALYRAPDDSYIQKMINIDSRTEKVQNLIKSLGMKENELWKKSIDINLEGDMGVKTYTAAELLGFLSAIRDDYSRAAVMFGNLLTEKERQQFQRPNVIPEELNALKLIAGDRLDKVNEAAQRLIKENPNYQKILNAIDRDFIEGGKRLSGALVKYNNTFMSVVDHYFPMMRAAAVNQQAEGNQQLRELMGSSAGAFNLYVEKGMTQNRVEIPPQYQTAIKLDLLAVWSEAVNKEEHFIAYSQLVKDLNQVYKNDRQVRNTIGNRYGEEAIEYIDKYINELANPNPENNRSSLDKFVKTLRGNTAAAYLGWKASSIALQGITSPGPFLAYINPIEYWGTYLEYCTHKGKLWKEICELSPHMKHRSMNMMTDLIKRMAADRFDTKVNQAISKFNDTGIKGIELIDNLSVAPGWLALYRKEHKRLQNENNNVKLSAEDIKVKAAQYADDIIRLTQPSGRADDLSPLFKSGTELHKAFLQFTQSLNVIWQNIRYDMPQMIREKKFINAAGTIIGYSLAGLMLGIVMTGFDDDDDDAEKIKKMAFWATTQFTDSFPIIGSMATNYAEQLITGKTRYSRGFNIFPALDKAMDALNTTTKAIQKEEYEKLLKAGMQAIDAYFMTKGLPVSGKNEIGKLFGIGDGDGEFNFNPGAVIGRDKDAVLF